MPSRGVDSRSVVAARAKSAQRRDLLVTAGSLNRLKVMGRMRSICAVVLARLRLRFSLRTLVVSALLAAGVINLAWHWAPWREQWSVTSQASFSWFLPDGTGFVAVREPACWSTGRPSLLVRETESGRLVKSLRLESALGEQFLASWSSADSRYIFVRALEWQPVDYFRGFEYPSRERMCFWAWDSVTDEVKRFDTPEGIRCTAVWSISPNGCRVVLCTEKELQLLDLRTTKIMARKPRREGFCFWRAEWAPTGEWLALKGSHRQGENSDDFIWLLDGHTLDDIDQITEEPPSGFGYMYPLDEDRLVVSCGPVTPYMDSDPPVRLRSFIYQVNERKRAAEIPAFVYDVQLCKGQALAVVEDEHGYWRYDLAHLRPLNRIQDHQELPWGSVEVDTRFTQDGSRIVKNGNVLYGTSSGPCSAALFAAETGDMILDLGSSFPKTSPDERWITNEETGAVCSTMTGTEVHRYPKDGHVLFMPDGEGMLVEEDADDAERFTLVTRCRPEQWWGVAWLHEFWLALLLTIAFGWSCILDRRILRN